MWRTIRSLVLVGLVFSLIASGASAMTGDEVAPDHEVAFLWPPHLANGTTIVAGASWLVEHMGIRFDSVSVHGVSSTSKQLLDDGRVRVKVAGPDGLGGAWTAPYVEDWRTTMGPCSQQIKPYQTEPECETYRGLHGLVVPAEHRPTVLHYSATSAEAVFAYGVFASHPDPNVTAARLLALFGVPQQEGTARAIVDAAGAPFDAALTGHGESVSFSASGGGQTDESLQEARARIRTPCENCTGFRWTADGRGTTADALSWRVDTQGYVQWVHVGPFIDLERSHVMTDEARDARVAAYAAEHGLVPNERSLTRLFVEFDPPRLYWDVDFRYPAEPRASRGGYHGAHLDAVDGTWTVAYDLPPYAEPVGLWDPASRSGPILAASFVTLVGLFLVRRGS